MTGKIYPSIFVSVLFHSLFIMLLLFGIKNSAINLKNTTYVTLIQESGNSGAVQSSSEIKEEKKSFPEKTIVKQENRLAEKTNKISKDEEQLLQERLAALRAKKKILESKLTSKNQNSSTGSAGSVNIKGEGVSSSYLVLISGVIRQNWNIPDTLPRNLEAVVSIRILSNGKVIIEGFEKRSGNPLFDSSVLHAIKISSPLPAPKSEVIVGLRFKP